MYFVHKTTILHWHLISIIGTCNKIKSSQFICNVQMYYVHVLWYKGIHGNVLILRKPNIIINTTQDKSKFFWINFFLHLSKYLYFIGLNWNFVIDLKVFKAIYLVVAGLWISEGRSPSSGQHSVSWSWPHTLQPGIMEALCN